MKFILIFIISILVLKLHGMKIKCDATLSIAIFADKEMLDKLSMLKMDIREVAKVLNTNVQQLFLAQRFGGKNLVLEVVSVSELPDEVKGSDDAKEYLNNFCKAQATFKMNGLWDHALLLTGRDIESPALNGAGKNFAVRGLSYLGSMCGPTETKCSIVEGNQLHTAVVSISHEIGHAFGLNHDEETDCKSDPGIMSKSLELADIGMKSFKWSACSLEKIKADFESKRCRCLMKTNGTNDLLKGQDFVTLSGDKQCNFAYGNLHEMFGGEVNGTQVDVCVDLYCINTSSNEVKFQPGAPSLGGTECGNGKRCWNQKCIEWKDVDLDVECDNTDEDAESQIARLINAIVENVFQIIKSITELFNLKL